MAFFLFGDNSPETHGFYADLCRQGNLGILAKSFIDQVGLALKREIEQSGTLDRSTVPIFRTVQQLNEKYHFATAKHAGIENALLCVAQITHYLDRAQKHPEDCVLPGRTHFVGLGTGLFSAAAVACAPSPENLVPIAVQAVLLAFRIGSYVESFAEPLRHAGDVSESWAVLASDVTEQQAGSSLAQYHTSHSIPLPSQAYISGIGLRDLEISGPPATLSALIRHEVLDIKPETLPVYGPYHATHLHSSADIDEILALYNEDLDHWVQGCSPESSIISSDGSWLDGSDTRTLLRSIGHACLTTPTNLRAIFDRCAESAHSLAGPNCLILCYGPTQLGPDLAKAIAHASDLVVDLKMPPQRSSERFKNSIGNHGPNGRCKLAIVGMSGRFPDAASHEALWELLCKGLDVHRVVPKDRFNVDTHVDPTGKAMNTSHTPYGCWIENPGLFDPRFFNMSPREALQTDPMQRLAIATAYEALEMSGYVPNRTPSTKLDRIGTFYGQTSDDWREINAAQEIDTYFITGGVRAFGPGRINYHFGFSGPSLSIDTACSSSAAALQVACTSLWAKECDTAVVGGLSVLGNPDIFSGLSRGQFLSKTGPCATFDNAADGYCRADGCASVIVKRLDDAIFDKDNILAVILGTATNHSADAISITHPHGPTQSILSRAILDDAGVDPLDVDYVEMHGTGTQAGDGTEMVSVTDVFAPANRKRPADRPLYLGAVKANVGHGEAASGVTALCKVLMMFQKNIIPPHVGIKAGSIMNVTFPKDLSDRNVNIPFHMTPLKRSDGKPRRIFINNFSAAGGNTGLLLEDGPRYEAPKPDPRGTHVITVTAKSKGAMIRNAKNLVSWISQHQDTPVSDVAYTTTARRIQHHWRMSVTATTLSEAQLAIEERLKGNFVPISPSTSGNNQPHIAFIFTGQGSHYTGMGKAFYAHYSVFRESINDLDQLARVHGFPSFLGLIDGSVTDVSSLSPVIVQLGLCCFEMALARLWASWGIIPDVVLGHSLGEYAALSVAGVLSASDAIYLVGKRAELLVTKCTAGTHAMLAVQGSVTSVVEALEGQQVNVACINGPRETVLSGESGQIADIAGKLDHNGFKCTQLKVPFAFHSAQVDPILDEFERLASSVTFGTPKFAVISPYLGRPLDGEHVDAKYLRNHAREPVNFLGGLAHSQQHGTIDDKTLWIEVGPHPTCANMVKAAFGSSTVAVPTLRRNEDAHKLLCASLSTLHGAGLNLDWNEFHRDFADSTRLLDLPAYSYDDKKYWLQYEGDWTLTKNRGSLPAPVAVEPSRPKLSTTSVHEVTKEEMTGDVAIIETETNLSRDDIRPAVTGHVCNGAPLLPSTLYADMAMTVCDYAYKLLLPDATTIGLNVGSVEVTKTLIFDETLEAHILRCYVKADISLGYADVVFHTGEGTRRVEHAVCRVFYGDLDKWNVEFEKVNYLIKSRIDHLLEAERTGKASKIGRGLAYKLFAALVDYDPRYRGMEEVILDSDTCEATAKVVFQTTEADGNFFFSPYWMDSCCHISGFIINGTDAVDSREQVFISHGWGSLRFLEKLDRNKTYRSYVRMQPVKGTKMMMGDAYVFEDDRIVGVCSDLKFQSIPRKVLNVVLPPRGAAAAGMGTVKTSPATSAQRSAPALYKSAKDETKRVDHAISNGANSRRSSSVVLSFLSILEKEVGCDPDELADNIAFADLGCDSLMALTVAGKMREEIEIDLDSHAFIEHATIGEFKKFLAQFDAQDNAPRESLAIEESGASSGLESESSGMGSDTSVTTPSEGSDQGSLKEDDAVPRDLQHIVRSTVAQEMGVNVNEVLAAPDLAALGMDSLMSLTILGNLREKTGLSIDNDLFVTSPSIVAVEKALGIADTCKPAKRAKAPKPSVRTMQVAAPTTVINTHPGNTTASIKKPPPPKEIFDHYPHRKATSVLLQGNVRTATHNLFMIPDGSGCATSYTEISHISPNWAVWGLFSPFMKTPEEFKCGVYGMATKFLQEIKQRQPTGPYSLAGWSAGGVIAFEIVNQLAQKKEEAEHLILIDAPCPVTIEPLPESLHSWFASIGLLGEGDEETAKKIPSWLLPHFAASVRALSSYTAVRIPSDKCPKVTTIWCEDGVCKTPSDPRPDPYPTGHALFLLDNRVDFGPNRWDEYLDISKFQTRHMPGNHFSMMHGDYAKQLGEFIREAVNS